MASCTCTCPVRQTTPTCSVLDSVILFSIFPLFFVAFRLQMVSISASCCFLAFSHRGLANSQMETPHCTAASANSKSSDDPHDASCEIHFALHIALHLATAVHFSFCRVAEALFSCCKCKARSAGATSCPWCLSFGKMERAFTVAPVPSQEFSCQICFAVFRTGPWMTSISLGSKTALRRNLDRCPCQ